MDVFALLGAKPLFARAGLNFVAPTHSNAARYSDEAYRLCFGVVCARDASTPDLLCRCLDISERTALIFEGPASRRKPRSGALTDASDRCPDVSNSKPDLRRLSLRPGQKRVE